MRTERIPDGTEVYWDGRHYDLDSRFYPDDFKFYLSQAKKAGIDVAGLDVSPPMPAQAKLKAELWYNETYKEGLMAFLNWSERSNVPQSVETADAARLLHRQTDRQTDRTLP